MVNQTTRDVVVEVVYGESDYEDVVVGSYMVNQTTVMSWYGSYMVNQTPGMSGRIW